MAESQNKLNELLASMNRPPREISEGDWKKLIDDLTQAVRSLQGVQIADEGDKDPIPEEVRQIPAHYVDTWFYNYSENGIRLTFGEGMAGETAYRTAIFLTPRTVQELIDGLTRTLATVRGLASKDG